MLKRFVARIFDWLIAIAIVCVLLWFVITQPLLSVKTAEDLPQVNQSNLKNHITNLVHINTSRELAQSAMSADDYIFNYFSRLGSPSLQGYTTMGGRHNNVRLRLGPRANERVVIGVQYLPPTGKDRRYWNPSGVAALLEAARVFSLTQDDLPLSVEFVAYASAGVAANGTLEMGSYHHAQLLKSANVPVKLMIALKSVGYFTEEPNSQRYPFSFMRMLYPNKGNFIGLSSRLQDFSITRAAKRSFLSVPGLPVESFSAPENFPLVAGSDHVNYWVNDFPAVQVSDMLPFRVAEDGYSPETQTMNYERIAQVVQGVVQLTRHLGESAKDEASEQGFWAGLFVKSSDLFE